MRIRLAFAFALVLAGLGLGTAAASPDAAALGVAVAGEAATGALLDEEHGVLIVQLGDTAPGWAQMRELVKAAQSKLDVDGSVPGWGVALMWPSGKMAISQTFVGRVQTEVGDGHTMLQDKAEYALAASPVAVQRSAGYSWGSGYSAGEKVTCKGSAQNLGAAAAKVVARCTIYGVVTARSAGAWRTDVAEKKETRTVILATKDHSLGTLKPGKKGKYSFKLVLADVQSDTTVDSFCMLGCSVESMSFSQTYLVDGAETAYFDDLRNTEGKAWLALLAGLEKDGLRLRVTGVFNPRETYQTFTIGEPFASLTGKKRAKAAKRIWKTLKAHVKKFAKAEWFIAYLTDEKGVSIGKLDDGGKYVEGW